MKKVLFIVLAAAMVGLTACNEQSTNGPDQSSATSTQLSKAISQFNVTTSQMSVLDEMYYLNEDLSILLTPKQVNTFNTLSVMFDGGPGGPRDPRMPMMDMSFLLQLRLLFQANPDMTDERKLEFTNLMQRYQEAMKAIIEKYRSHPDLDPAAMREELKNLRDKVQQQLDGMITETEKANLDALKAKIEAERQAMHDKMLELRIQRQLAIWTQILGLTEDQQGQIKKLLLGQDADIQALREKYKNDPAGFRQALLELQQTLNKNIAATLNADQLAIWERLMQRMGRGGKMGGRG